MSPFFKPALKGSRERERPAREMSQRVRRDRWSKTGEASGWLTEGTNYCPPNPVMNRLMPLISRQTTSFPCESYCISCLSNKRQVDKTGKAPVLLQNRVCALPRPHRGHQRGQVPDPLETARSPEKQEGPHTAAQPKNPLERQTEGTYRGKPRSQRWAWADTRWTQR